MKISVHSLIDIITNSSTEVFLWFEGGAVKIMHKFLEGVLANAGVTDSVDDLFEIRLEGSTELIVIPKNATGIARLNLATDFLDMVGADAEYNG